MLAARMDRAGQTSVRGCVDPETAAWLLLSILSARPLRAAAMPDEGRREADVTVLSLRVPFLQAR